MNAHVSLHDLSAAVFENGAAGRSVYVHDDGKASVQLADGTRLHWGSLDALDAFVDRLGELAYKARQADARRRYVPLNFEAAS